MTNYLNLMHKDEYHNIMADVYPYLPQIQCLLALLISKVYNQLIFNEFFNPNNYNEDLLYSLSNQLDIIGELTHYMITYHSSKIKAGFKGIIVQRLSDTLN